MDIEDYRVQMPGTRAACLAPGGAAPAAVRGLCWPGRRTFAVLRPFALGAGLLATGCVTPIVLTAEAQGLGVFVLERASPSTGVMDTRIAGLGLLHAFGRFSVGWSELSLVRVDSASRSFAGSTSVGQFAVGRRAEELARALSGAWPELP